MEPSKNGGMLGGAEKIVAKFSDEQKRIFSNLASVVSSKSVASSSCSRNQGQNTIKPPGSLDDSIISSDDDCIIIDISDDDEKEVMLEDVSSEMSNESRKDENGPAATELKVESDVGSESEQDWEVITIDDDDEDKPKIPPERMICYRCPSKKLGAFKDVKKYFAHIKRHVFSDHFACPKCQRPFLKLNYCLSHELRVHGSTLECEIKDPVISMAKSHVNAIKAKSSKAGPSTRKMETDEEDIDCEDVKFYENRFSKSSSMYPYRGPLVTTILEAYEIQNFQPRKKANRVNGVARIALTVHKQNVEKDQDTFKLGKFSGRKGQRGKIADPNAIKPIPKKKPAKAKQTVKAKRPRETASESEINAKEQPKKKRVRYAYMTSSSSSSPSESEIDNTTDADYAPSKKKRYDDKGTVSSSSQQQPDKVKYKKALPPIMDRKCVKCKNFEWNYPDELRSHRQAEHPTTPLVDLMAVLCPVAQSRKGKSNKHEKKVDVKVTEKKEVNKTTIKNNEKIVPAPSKKADKKVSDTTKKEPSKARKTANAPKKGEKTTTDVSAKKIRIQRKGRSKGDHVPKSQFPLPDSTFSQKELFLDALGLSNCVRLHLHQKKPIEELELPPCSVMVQKLSDLEMSYYSNRGSMSSSLHNLLQGHFLAS